jgi:hypothetical protein
MRTFPLVFTSMLMAFGLSFAQAETVEEAAEKFLKASTEKFENSFLHLDPEELVQVERMFLEATLLDRREGRETPFLKPGETEEQLRNLPRGEFVKRMAAEIERRSPAFVESMKKTRWKILGNVVDGEFTYVVVKMFGEMDGVKIDMVEVFPFVKRADGFKPLLKANMKQAVELMAKRPANLPKK